MSDNQIISATGDTLQRLGAVLALCDSWRDNKPKFCGWDPCETGILLYSRPGRGTPFPLPIGAQVAAEMSYAFISTIEKWPPSPDIDGDCKKGWSLVFDGDTVTIGQFWTIYHK